MDATVAQLIEQFGMAPLPVEGTLFAETFRGAAWSAGVGLFAVDPPSRSLFHRLAFDEVWHFYAGDALRLVLLHPDGSDEEVVMGGDLPAGERRQHVVPAGTWQAGELVPGGAWALYGCTMAPGFTAECFEGGAAATLLATHPGRSADIERLAV
jgi:predicted cupin superfamily sugar epimerase